MTGSQNATLGLLIMYCSVRLLTFTSLTLGAISVGTLSLGVATDHWVLTEMTISPVVGNQTVNVETRLSIHIGLWRICILIPVVNASDAQMCYFISYFGQSNDRPDEAPIAFSISRAIRVAAPMPVIGLVLVVIAFTLDIVGGVRRDGKAIAAAVFYILVGLLLAVGMILYISAINDEVGHSSRSGIKDSFRYTYGWSFIFIVIAFVSSEMAAVFCISMYLRFHTTLNSVIKMVPGIEDRINLDECRSSNFSKRHMFTGISGSRLTQSTSEDTQRSSSWRRDYRPCPTNTLIL